MIGNVPDGWRVEKLSECGQIITGKTPSKNIEEYWDSDDISFIKPDDFTKDSIIEFDKGKDFVSYKGFEKNPTIPPYSVLTTCIGNIGKVLINKNEATTNQQINTIVPNKDIHYKFLAYSILKIKPIMLQRANAPIVPMINKTDFGRYEIPIPPLPQQEKIVKVLDISSGLIEKQKELIENYDLFLKSKFIEMFGDPIQNPMGWEVVKLNQVLINIDSGWSPVCKYHSRKKENYGVLKLSALSNDTYKYSENKEMIDDIEPKRNHLVANGDLLFSRKNTYMLVGSCAYVFNTENNLFIPDLIFRLNTNHLINKIFLWKYLINDTIKMQLRNIANGAAASMPNISKAKLLDFKIVLPPIVLQNKFASIVETTDAIKTKEIQKLEHLEILHSSLMDKAFNGGIE